MADVTASGAHPLDPVESGDVRDPLPESAAVRAARLRPMSERLELALNWNRVASELRVGLSVTRGGPSPEQ